MNDKSKSLPPEAIRALEEARERRQVQQRESNPLPVEHKGRKGPEPTRYGDWEKGGIVSDF